MHIAHISTFPPTRCGIAEFANDLVESLSRVKSCKYRLGYSAENEPGFAATIVTKDRGNLAQLAEAINTTSADVVDLQHEFGIWGGDEGENLLTFLEMCRKPIVATLHTTFAPDHHPKRASILREICLSARKVVVLSPKAAENVTKLDGAILPKIAVIRHGVPKIKFVGRAIHAEIEEKNTEPLFVSPGFFRPDKGGEQVLRALAKAKSHGLRFQHIFVGGIQRQFAEQDSYKHELSRLAFSLGFKDEVIIEERDFDRDELIKFVQDADCGLIGYQNPIQSSSGIVPLILSAGRPVISTPIEYSRQASQAISGVILADNFSADALCAKILQFSGDVSSWRRRFESIYAETRGWAWPQAAAQYRFAFQSALTGRSELIDHDA